MDYLSNTLVGEWIALKNENRLSYWRRMSIQKTWIIKNWSDFVPDGPFLHLSYDLGLGLSFVNLKM